MSKLLHLINRLKAQASPTFLTATQQQTLRELQRAWRFPEKINLHGPGGSGKTFVGWVLARQHPARFYATPRLFFADDAPSKQPVIIDNAPTDERQLRTLLAELQLRMIKRAMFISHTPIRVPWPTVPLPPPTAADIETVYQQCGQLMSSFTNQRPEPSTNLWQVIRAML